MSAEHLIWLAVAHFAAATFAGALGMGGGVLVTAALSTFLPITVVVPLQNAMMLSTGATRIWIFRQHLNWNLATPFILGLALGVGIGAPVYAAIPEQWLKLIVAISMLSVLFSPQELITRIGKSANLRFGIGLLHGFLSTLTSMGGLLQGVFSRLPLKKDVRNGTFAVLITCGNTFKFIGYILSGISLMPYWPIIFLAIPIGYLGTWIGKNTLDARISELWAKRVFQTLVVTSALNLLYQWVHGIFGISFNFS